MENHDDMKKNIYDNQNEHQIYLKMEPNNQQNQFLKNTDKKEAQNDDLSKQLDENSSIIKSKPNGLANHNTFKYNSKYLDGKMISWMMPDGKEINEKRQSLPSDDDMYDIMVGRKKKSTVQELLDSMTMDEKPKVIFEIPSSLQFEPSTK